MTKENIISDLSKIVADVLLLDELTLTIETVAKDVEGWDSISYIEIISDIEKHFKVKFKLFELEEFLNIGDIVDCIHSKLPS